MSPGQQSHIVPWVPDYQPVKNEVEFFRSYLGKESAHVLGKCLGKECFGHSLIK